MTPGDMTYIPLDAPYHKEQEYIWFRGGDLNSFQDIQQFPIPGGVGMTPGVMTYIPLDAPYHKEQECIWFRGGDLNSFRDIQQFPVPGGVGMTPGAISNIMNILPVTLSI